MPMCSHVYSSTLFPIDPANNHKFFRLSNSVLLCLSQAGNAEASHCLIARYRELISKLAWRLTANTTDTDDLISETYLHLFSVINSCRNVDTLPGWIKKITQNEFYRLYNLRQRMRGVSLDYLTEIAGDTFLPTTSNDPARVTMDAFENAERLRRLHAAVGSLTASSHAMIEMFYLRDQSYDQISCQTGLRLGTIKSRLFRARKELQRKLDDLFA